MLNLIKKDLSSIKKYFVIYETKTFPLALVERGLASFHHSRFPKYPRSQFKNKNFLRVVFVFVLLITHFSFVKP